MRLKRLKKWDRRLVRLARSVRILGPLSWPDMVEAAFFSAGGRALPKPPPVEIDHRETIAALGGLVDEVDASDPIGAFLIRTAQSYRDAAEMLQCAHTPGFTTLSRKLYGSPRELIAPGAPTHLDAANHFIHTTH